jgi:hypothetical protein
MMHGNERVCSSSCNSICWAVDGHHGLLDVWVAASGVVVAVWVLDITQVIVFEVVATGFAAIINHDVACHGGVSVYVARD